jgi:fatty acid desaturase
MTAIRRSRLAPAAWISFAAFAVLVAAAAAWNLAPAWPWSFIWVALAAVPGALFGLEHLRAGASHRAPPAKDARP